MKTFLQKAVPKMFEHSLDHSSRSSKYKRSTSRFSTAPFSWWLHRNSSPRHASHSAESKEGSPSEVPSEMQLVERPPQAHVVPVPAVPPQHAPHVGVPVEAQRPKSSELTHIEREPVVYKEEV